MTPLALLLAAFPGSTPTKEPTPDRAGVTTPTLGLAEVWRRNDGRGWMGEVGFARCCRLGPREALAAAIELERDEARDRVAVLDAALAALGAS